MGTSTTFYILAAKDFLAHRGYSRRRKQ